MNKNLYISNKNTIFSTNILIPTIPLPIGISFYTFQAMSYVIDVYPDYKISQQEGRTLQELPLPSTFEEGTYKEQLLNGEAF